MGTPSLPPGSLFGNRFLIARLAGQGGMGTVYQATDQYSGTPVALKLLQDGGHPEELERFQREALLLAELRHPGIVSHISHGQTPTVCATWSWSGWPATTSPSTSSAAPVADRQLSACCCASPSRSPPPTIAASFIATAGENRIRSPPPTAPFTHRDRT